MEGIKEHFESEAQIYDQLIVKLIPYYGEMIKALVNGIPHQPENPIRVLDLGCGTGTVSQSVCRKFPDAHITCVDISPKMLEIAGNKLCSVKSLRLIHSDFYQFETDEKYDAVVSSLALHHLLTAPDKKLFYQKIFKMLNPGGVFWNADVVLGSGEFLQNQYMKEWKAFMYRNESPEKVENEVLVNYLREDRPEILMDQLHWLDKIGFQNVDVIWKYYNFAVYGGFCAV